MADNYQYQIPPNVDREEFMRTRVFVERDQVTNTTSNDLSGTWNSFDDRWDFDAWKQQFRLVINRMSLNAVEFDLIGVHASVANTLRRILIAEVPTMAIEDVFIKNNTSVMMDEVLAHRLGLIPLRADVHKFGERGPNDAPTDLNTIVLNLKVKCERIQGTPKSMPREQRLTNHTVYSRDIIWDPQGDQATEHRDNPIQPAFDDIVITKLNQGEELDIVMHARKGIGRDHAKYSPVGTASYRIMPEIHILRPIVGDAAHKFASSFPAGVIEIVKNARGQDEAKVADARKDTVSRNVLRHSEFLDAVTLSRKRDHFIFNVETVGSVMPAPLMVQAFDVLKQKCLLLRASLDNLNLQ
ncbi:hypothetical protein AMAG_14544 [Allomyces macrogynus ATCC 38327]|uniref:DNA-directed RNA polymerases I and III subunit RPAC1 n=1 Tax=Allomyces macrogynus (strain ATCC 38327) TaxID=578462 RepID=A0A0L0T6N9_ALLM3|nr:hypothetical protein AMAG_14544 [Allomyces macrogynus ATCC 38327]|eukprot:KNE70410.1 hypothetical protein AMAG_14544 [Allomyces macrogynus ATCC 38327]